MEKVNSCYKTKIGNILVTSDNDYLYSVALIKDFSESQETSISKQFIKEFNEYLDGSLKEFTTKIKLEGTPFQVRVWEALLDIPYGDTKTYKEIAHAINNDKAYRAVGNACNRNPLLIIVPCHRVIGTNSCLTGYALGLDLKDKLLQLERREA